MTDVRFVASGNVNHNCVSGLRKENFVTDVRLAANMRQGSGKLDRAMTDVRLVGAAWDGANDQISTGLRMTDVRLALSTEPGHKTMGGLRAEHHKLTNGSGRLPALLVSFFYFDGFARYRDRYAFRDYALDSGAYSVKHSGGIIDLGAYIDACLERLATDPQCTEVFALDVIDDWRASEKNTERMWKAGVPAIPVYHRGEPEGLLAAMARGFPKIGLGGVSQLRSTSAKLHWVEQCFARAWPARIHGLAVGNEKIMDKVPFHSVDATNWILGPAGFGSYKSMGKPHRAPRGKDVNLRAEVQWWLKLERRLKQRWASTLAKLETERTDSWPLRSVAAV